MSGWNTKGSFSMAQDGVRRRTFLTGSAAAALAGSAALWSATSATVPLARSAPIRTALPVPPDFPAGIALTQQPYQNWSKEIILDAVWTSVPTSPDDVVRLANWAFQRGYRLRPRGSMHGWTPLTVGAGENVDKIVLADTKVHLNGVSVRPGAPATVTAGPGATLEDILTALQAHGLGLANVPAPGALTIAGALAVDAHGATLPADGESPLPGQTYGSLSNLITALTAVVWDASAEAYMLRDFHRGDPDIGPLLTHLGRSFLTSVTLQAAPNYRLRCQSFVDIDRRELFAPGGAPGRTFESYVRASGRVEAIMFPYTDKPWLKVWTPTPTKPAESREVTAPYNYPFSDNVPEPVTDLLRQIQLGAVNLAPELGAAQLGATVVGLPATGATDLWGWSKDLLFYIKPTTLRLTEGGGAVITSRANIGRAVHEFAEWFVARVDYYRARGEYPINGPVEIRCCGLDNPADLQVPVAGPPTISAMRPRPDHPEWDAAIWLNVLSTPGTPQMFRFYQEMEEWMRANYSGGYATFRPEWSKGWAFGPDPYTEPNGVEHYIPDTYRAGVPSDDGWDAAVAAFDRHDPHRIFSNRFMDWFL